MSPVERGNVARASAPVGGAPIALRQAQERSVSPEGGSWPVTCRDPALGTKTDSEPESQRTVMSRSWTAVTTPLRVTVPTFSDSTSTRSPTWTILGLLWRMTEPGTPRVRNVAGIIQDAAAVAIGLALRSLSPSRPGSWASGACKPGTPRSLAMLVAKPDRGGSRGG